MKTSRALLLGALTVGTLDILDAIVFFSLRNYVAAITILQSIAAGLRGRAAFSGGLRTAILGGAFHYFPDDRRNVFCAEPIHGCAVRAAVLCGMLYGIGVYLFMNLVVLPLSKTGRGAFV